jgi:citrate synthase
MKMSEVWTTAVTRIDPEEVYLRGFPLGEMIGKLPFSAATFLLIRGRMPSPAEAGMIDAILCGVLDYGLKKPGTVAARYCVSANPSITAGLATAVLSVGEYTLAPDAAGAFIRSTFEAAQRSGESLDLAAQHLVEELSAKRDRVPGFGHPQFRFFDPRAQTLKRIAQESGIWGEYCDWYETVHGAFVAKAGKPAIVINDVGMMAAILTQMGFAPHEMTGIAIISSLPGVIAHLSEELASGVRIRTLPDSMVDTRVDTLDLGQALDTAGWPV